ncbi:MAG: class I SAM-dependent methyltransferase [Pseudonocardiaceae bacterium]
MITQDDVWNGDEGRHWAVHHERYDEILRRFTPHLLEAADVAAGERVVDIGCGSGQTTCAVARATRHGLALGVDLSRPLLKEARRRAAYEDLANVHFEQGDAQVHPFAPEGYDLAMSRFGVMFFEAPAVAFVHIAGAVRPGGRLVFLCWQDAAHNGWFTTPVTALAAHVDVPEMSEDEPGPFSLADPRRIRKHLDGAGFIDVSIAPLAEPMRWGSDVDDVLDFIRNRGRMRDLLAGTDEITRRKALDSMRAALRPCQSTDGVFLGGTAWLVTAHRP